MKTKNFFMGVMYFFFVGLLIGHTIALIYLYRKLNYRPLLSTQIRPLKSQEKVLMGVNEKNGDCQHVSVDKPGMVYARCLTPEQITALGPYQWVFNCRCIDEN